MPDVIPVYIGYDGDVEPVAYHVCCDTLIRHSSRPLRITPLALNTMRSFYDEQHLDGSNAFIYSRFLIPYMESWKGHAIYLDGDMILRGDIVGLWEKRDHYRAVQVVKHDYKTQYKTKYRGARNQDYPRKNWSSVMLWNCGSFKNRCLRPEFVAESNGSFLHQFKWLEDDMIGALDAEWNRLVLEQRVMEKDRLLHYTVGTPCFADYCDAAHSQEWHEARALAFSHKEA